MKTANVIRRRFVRKAATWATRSIEPAAFLEARVATATQGTY